jgi:hypothetical protein
MQPLKRLHSNAPETSPESCIISVHWLSLEGKKVGSSPPGPNRGPKRPGTGPNEATSDRTAD